MKEDDFLFAVAVFRLINFQFVIISDGSKCFGYVSAAPS
jgi:hypothetical protein